MPSRFDPTSRHAPDTGGAPPRLLRPADRRHTATGGRRIRDAGRGTGPMSLPLVAGGYAVAGYGIAVAQVRRARTALSAMAEVRALAATEAWAAAEPGGLDRGETLSAHLAVDLLRAADRRQPRNAVSSETTASGRSSWRVWPQSSARPETVVAFSRQVASTS